VKQLFGAAVILTVAAMAAAAQVADDKTGHTALPQTSSPDIRCDPAPARFSGHDCDPQTERPTRPTAPSRRQFLSRLTPEFVQTPVGEGGAVPAEELSEEREETVRARRHFNWGAAVRQSLLFLSVQHGYALTQPKTRRDLSGNFLKDYARSVRSLHGWGDGGRFFTNYVAHPMQGSLLGFVQIQNDPAGSRRRFGASRGYWRSRMKALAWSAAWSTQFEIGPVSQASIGNVGLHGKQTYVDIVITPTVGLGLLVAEDVLDRYVIERIERRTHNKYVRILSRMVLNPTRSAANLLRFKKPWRRDAGLR
jgi:hypothetical protein